MLMPEHNDYKLYNTTLKTKALFMYTSSWRFVGFYERKCKFYLMKRDLNSCLLNFRKNFEYIYQRVIVFVPLKVYSDSLNMLYQKLRF